MEQQAIKNVPATEKTIRIIEWMANPEVSSFGVTEIADALDYNKGTVYPILQTLIRLGWVEKDYRTGKYNLSNRLSLISGQAEKGNRLISDFLLVGNNMERHCGELVNLHFLEGLDSAKLIAKVAATGHSLRVDFPLGTVFPVIASSAGKCLISDMDQVSLRRSFGYCNKHFTTMTIQSEDVFLQEIQNIREKGYATNMEEYEEGICSVAAPVRNGRGMIIAAINIVLPVTRYNEARRQELIALVREGALRLSALHS